MHRPKTWLLLFVLLIAACAQVQDKINPYYFDILITIGINIVLGVSLNLVNGYTGQFSLGHAGFMAVGAYAAAAASIGITFTYFDAPSANAILAYLADPDQMLFFIVRPLAWLIHFGIWAFLAIMNAILFIHNEVVSHLQLLPRIPQFVGALCYGGGIAALAGFAVGVPSLRLKGDYLAIVTLGFGEIIRVVIQNTEAVGGSRGLSIPSRETGLFGTYLAVALTVYVVVLLVHSTYGRGFLTVRDDEIAAEAMGINTTKYKVIAFVVAAFFAGVAGGLYAHFKQFIHPEGFGFLRSVDIVVIVILGGMGNTPGVILAAILLTILPEGLRALAGWDVLPMSVREIVQNRMILYSLLLIGLMLTRPQGLFSGGGKITKWLKGRASA